MANLLDSFNTASIKTAAALQTIAATPKIAELSRLSLPEIQHITDQIAQVVPAGNVPGLILSGLTRIEGRQVPSTERQRHLGMLFRGVRDLLDKAVYSAMFAGPAAIIMGYQKILQLAGKDIDAAFPEGTWQFYLHFALREDTARHANETIGFRRSLAVHRIKLSEVDALAAWIMAAMVTLYSYDQLLENEWRERVYTTLLTGIASEAALSSDVLRRINNAYTEWERQRPYQRGNDAGELDYPAYRRQKFDEFLRSMLALLPLPVQEAFASAVRNTQQTGLPAYQSQMSILAQLVSGEYQDSKNLYPLNQAKIGIVYQGQYTFLALSDFAAHSFSDFQAVREVAASLLARPNTSVQTSEADLLLSRASRAAQTVLRTIPEAAHVVQQFQYVPILINWDKREAGLPLAAIRQGLRGVGDHALTLFFTEDSTVFDQSHIFFDGAWGAALAEIMTNEALSWALYFSQLPDAKANRQLEIVTIPASAKLREAAQKARLPIEAYAENTEIRMGAVLTLRRLFKTRNDLVNMTVNDLLILYRAIHGQRYMPSAALRRQLELLSQDSRPDLRHAYNEIQDALDKIQRSNPSVLIPMDASQHEPRERLFPTTFRNPMVDLLPKHDASLAALDNYKNAPGDRSIPYQIFDERQREYLRMIAGFGELMRKYKDVALSGQSTSTTAIKMLAHMPDALQRLLDQIPGRFDVLNEIIKGEEVFSNVGRVAKGSTLRRFITAKDDNQQKTLAWGVVTDDTDTVHISLRDFRPHVTLLYELGTKYSDSALPTLANRIAQDFLDSYVEGFNRFIRELRDITVSSRETRSRDLPES